MNESRRTDAIENLLSKKQIDFGKQGLILVKLDKIDLRLNDRNTLQESRRILKYGQLATLNIDFDEIDIIDRIKII